MSDFNKEEFDECVHGARYHLRFYRKLVDLLPDEFHGWKCTALFYAAIHLIDALVVKEDLEDFPNNHMERKRLIDGQLKLPNYIKTAFFKLKRNSEESRYIPFTYKADSVPAALESQLHSSQQKFDELKRYLIQERGFPEDCGEPLE